MPGATRYVPVDPSLTDPTPAPAKPTPACKEGDYSVLCDTQIAVWMREHEAALESCNADKAAIATLPIKEQK